MSSQQFQVRFSIDNQFNLESQSRKLLQNDISQNQNNQANVKIHVTNLESLDEFEGVTQINQDYLPKLQSWINKKKYQCSEIYGSQVNQFNNQFMNHVNVQSQIDEANESEQALLQLQVDIFKFLLIKIEKSDMEKIREEMRTLEQERLLIDKEMKLFNFMFFSHCQPRDFRQQNVNNNQIMGGSGFNQNGFQNFMFPQGAGMGPNSHHGGAHGTGFTVQTLYHVIKGQGFVEVAGGNADGQQILGGQSSVAPEAPNLEMPSALSDEFDRSNNNQGVAQNPSGQVGTQQKQNIFMIEMKEPLPQDTLTLSYNNQGPQSKVFEVIVFADEIDDEGQNGGVVQRQQHNIARMCKIHQKKIVQVDQTLYYYQISCPVRNGQNYTIHIPKAF